MKKPDRYMSSSEFSFLVVRICALFGAFFFLFVIFTSGRTLTWDYEIPLIILLTIVGIVSLTSLLDDCFRKEEVEEDSVDEEKNEEDKK